VQRRMSAKSRHAYLHGVFADLNTAAEFAADPNSSVAVPMSALGQKQTSMHVQTMSALPPIADIGQFTFSADDIALRSYRASRLIVPLLKQPCAYPPCY
jgi:hypothetical protein